MLECCTKDDVENNPCQAIADGLLNNKTYRKYGLSLQMYMQIVAQCGTTSAVNDLAPILNQLLACCNSSLVELQAINTNTVNQETQLNAIITLLTDGNADIADILIAIQAVLVEVIAIEGNTDGIEGLLTTMITLLTSISVDTTDIEALITTILANQIDPDLFGVETLEIGTHAAAPAAGPYLSWTVVKTNDAGTVRVDGLTLNGVGDATSEKALPQFTIPTPSIVLDGGNLGEYEWKTYS